MSRPHARRRASAPVVLLAALFLAVPASASASDISGYAFKDLNRDGARQADEPVLADQQINLIDSSDRLVASRVTDASGRYGFTGLADGSYRLRYDYSSWEPLRNDWVPTTSGSLEPDLRVSLSGSATANFGWRAIVRSSDYNAPITEYTAPNGLKVQSYDDVVSARQVYDVIATGMVGAEAPTVTVRFDFPGAAGHTVIGYMGSEGNWSGYRATPYITYASWIDGPIQVAHEYGHAWSTYYATMVQQDSTFTAYLKARGLYGDSRVNSSYRWSAEEMIAEDYRQLLGPPATRAASQMNYEIPLAKDVPGLADFLANTYTKAPGGSSSSPAPQPAPAPALAVSGLAMNPDPVVRSGTASFQLSAPATVTARVLDAKGAVVRTLLAGVSKPSGSVSVTWDRKDANGRKVRSGTYSVAVSATDASGASATASDVFTAS